MPEKTKGRHCRRYQLKKFPISYFPVFFDEGLVLSDVILMLGLESSFLSDFFDETVIFENDLVGLVPS